MWCTTQKGGKGWCSLIIIGISQSGKLKLIKKPQIPWIDWFYLGIQMGNMISSVTGFSSSRGKVGVFHHFVTVTFFLLFLGSIVVKKALDMTMSTAKSLISPLSTLPR